MNVYFDICELSNASVSKFVLILYVCSSVYYVGNLFDDVTKLSCQTGQYLVFFLQIFRKLANFCPTIINLESRIISEQNCLINNDLWSHFFATNLIIDDFSYYIFIFSPESMLNNNEEIFAPELRSHYYGLILIRFVNSSN